MLEAVYFIVMVTTGLMLTASLIFGELAEWLGHLGESAANAIESGINSLPFIDHFDFGGHLDGDHFSGFGVTRSFLTFATVFSGTGFLAVRYLKVSEPISAIIGLIVGSIAGLLTFAMMRLMVSQNSPDVPDINHYVGKTGVITVPIGESGNGVIMFSGGVAGNITMTAVSHEKLERGQRVLIVSIAGSNAYVRKINQGLEGG